MNTIADSLARRLVPISVMILAASSAACSHSEARMKNLSTGQATQRWLDEQRNDINRADSEPYPAERAGMAAKRYNAGPATPGTPGTSTPSAGSASNPGAATANPGASAAGMMR